jgi:hypothetical protein
MRDVTMATPSAAQTGVSAGPPPRSGGMSAPHAPLPWPVPTWMKALGSAAALGHLFAIGMLALAAQSGPWPAPAPIFTSEQEGPQFAKSITLNLTYPMYLKPLRMTHNYHFTSNRTDMNTVSFEVRLKDANGEVFDTLKFPDEKANFWVRHRQTILARSLGNDQPVQSTGPVKVPAVNKDAETFDIWKVKQPGVLELVEVAKNAPLEANAMRPSDLSKEFARAYVRFLLREHKSAASAELVRLHRDPLPPFYWFIPGMPPADAFLTTKSHFGEFRRDQ